jgi:hypothetical protein
MDELTRRVDEGFAEQIIAQPREPAGSRVVKEDVQWTKQRVKAARQ